MQQTRLGGAIFVETEPELKVACDIYFNVAESAIMGKTDTYSELFSANKNYADEQKFFRYLSNPSRKTNRANGPKFQPRPQAASV